MLYKKKSSTNLVAFLNKFEEAESGNGNNRMQCLTHDTNRTLVQTTRGMTDLCSHLFEMGFEYILLREIQNDKIEGELRTHPTPHFAPDGISI